MIKAKEWSRISRKRLSGTRKLPIRDLQFNLGVSYGKGEGVEQHFISSYLWLNIATSNGYEDAKKIKGVLAEDMTPAQIAKAEELVKEMVKKNPKLLKKQ